ncbi:MAG: hypothetical protein HUK24_06100 [Sphaerochaetaceae bacterium]|nr:hypothetical protein [Sphaerochaetaceae bacterium]
MKTVLVRSPLNENASAVDSYCSEYLKRLTSLCGIEFETGTIDDLKDQNITLFLIGSGGSENQFATLYPKTKGPYYLLTVPAFNSLAAALEISGFLKNAGEKVEILHGSEDLVASKLTTIINISQQKNKLNNLRLGVFGQSSWLIASIADPLLTKKNLNMEIVSLSIEELVEEYRNGGYESNNYIETIKTKSFNKDEIEKALNIYGALCRLINKYNLDGITIKCFDLLNLANTTGCLALALLNTQGIPASCEGDTKALISMMVIKAVTGCSSFMANPCFIDKNNDEMVFAHCTIPLDFIDSYSLVTHYESGIGVAISADLKPQTVTLFKCDENMNNYFIDTASLVKTTHEPNLCRTQMRLKLKKGSQNFLSNAICNHQLIIPRDYEKELRAFMESFNN